jgi:hypothetical protein
LFFSRPQAELNLYCTWSEQSITTKNHTEWWNWTPLSLRTRAISSTAAVPEALSSAPGARTLGCIFAARES